MITYKFEIKNSNIIKSRLLIILICIFGILFASEKTTAQTTKSNEKKSDKKIEVKDERSVKHEKFTEPFTDNPTLFCGGVSDDFVCPSESTLSDTAIVNMLTNRYASTPCFSFLNFDDIPWRSTGCIDEKMGFFVHKITFPAGTIENATLEIKCRAASKTETTYDYISFFQGTNYLGSSFLKDLPGAGGTWNNDQQAIFTLDISSLPSSPGFDYTNILEYLQDGDLDIVIGTETGVDYVCLNLTKSLAVSVDFGWQSRLAPDTLMAYFRLSVSPYNIVDSQTVYASVVASSLTATNAVIGDILDKTSGTNPDSDTNIDQLYDRQENSNSDMPVSHLRAALRLPKLFEGNSYYLVLRNRNSIETWTASPVAISGIATEYDFTTSVSQAYGNNLIIVGGVASIYNGDINQDGIIDLFDVILVFNDASNFTSGYVVTDLNGDNIVDLSDLLIAFNNASDFVGVIRP